MKAVWERSICLICSRYGFFLIPSFLFFLFFAGFLSGKSVDQLFDHLFFHIDVEAQQADKGENVQKLLFFLRRVLKRIGCDLIAL